MFKVRIDSSLIHGQTQQWFSEYNTDIVIVVAEHIEQDKVLTKVLEMSTPTNIKLMCLNPASFNIKAKYDFRGYCFRPQDSILLIVESLYTFSKIENNIKEESVIIGNISKENNSKVTRITGNIYLTEQDKTIIASSNKRFYVQTFTTDDLVSVLV